MRARCGRGRACSSAESSATRSPGRAASAALEACSIAACSGGVYTFPVLKPDASRELVEEILNAKASRIGADLSLPNNGQDERTERTGADKTSSMRCHFETTFSGTCKT